MEPERKSSCPKQVYITLSACCSLGHWLSRSNKKEQELYDLKTSTRLTPKKNVSWLLPIFIAF